MWANMTQFSEADLHGVERLSLGELILDPIFSQHVNPVSNMVQMYNKCGKHGSCSTIVPCQGLTGFLAYSPSTVSYSGS